MRAKLFWRDIRGAAAVEMAMIAPFIGGLALLGMSVWQTASRIEDMRGALQSGVRYYMSGGFDDTAGRTFAMSSWDKKPSDGNISVQRVCKCEETVSTCGQLCPDQSPPAMFINLNATGTASNGVSTFSLDETKVVRVR